MCIEDLFPLEEAKKYLPQPPHRATLARWALKGVGGIRLETWVIGGRRYTSRAAIEQWIAAVSAAKAAPSAKPSGTISNGVMEAEKRLKINGV